ncbi:MAG: DEAD/DEAH box helicase family protein [Verrucomicrobia bacterium]|jgi:non-specific serine/threonine protein kinase|nr:DEAD/DEAH box helicase family protein [Verrucomicrobiota bacterium]
MATSKNRKTEGLEGFEKLELGQLYYVANRAYLDRGLALYRQFAVEELSWDAAKKTLTAFLPGGGRYANEVCLQVVDGRLKHTCDCATWAKQGDCAHVVAGMAAMFLAVQGKSAGGYAMPDDYAQELRRQLEYRDVGGEGHEADDPLDAEKTTIVLTEIERDGQLGFFVDGRLPGDFLRSFGVDLEGNYGFSYSRDFALEDPGEQLRPFLEKAKSAGYSVVTVLDDGPCDLVLQEQCLTVEIKFALIDEQVEGSVLFLDEKEAVIDVFTYIPGSGFVLATDGRLHPIDEEDAFALKELGSGGFRMDVASFNEQSLTPSKARERALFIVGERKVEPVPVPDAAISLEIDLTAMENAAGEWESFEFDLYLNFDGCRVDLNQMQEILLTPILASQTGKLLTAKRRVQAFFDLLRRVLASESSSEELDLASYAADYAELFSEDHRLVVEEIVSGMLRLLEAFGDRCSVALVDASQSRWIRGSFAIRQIAMLLFSISDVRNRSDLGSLAEGSIALANPEAGAEALQRIVSVSRNLSVGVQFNEQAIRSEPLNIQVDTLAGDSEIDWFRLHPSIRCGDRTIDQAEWQKLILGQLLIEDKDGSLIMPQLDGDAGGLALLADLLQPQRKKTGGGKNSADDGLQVSRLEMLDWIMLRKHGVQVTLPPEAEKLFASLGQFDRIESFQKPASLQAELRPYQNEGCAWIDFLYRHRFGACLADDMGLGKTVQTIGFLCRYFEQNPDAVGCRVLIVLPPSLVFNWLEEFERFAPSLNVVDCLGKARWKTALQEAQIILTTYDRVRIDLPAMRDHRFEIVVFDEAHNLKNVSAARTKAAARIERRFTLCLTGTPVENNASEFYSVMTAAVPGIFGNLKDFKESYRGAPHRILGRSRPFILRRTKEKILKELPKKEEHELFLEMSTLQKEIYTRTVAEVRAEVAEAYEGKPEQQAGIVALAAILRLRQVCVSPELLGKHMPDHAPKFSYMADRLEELNAEGHGALVFSQFIGGLDQMEAVARERGIEYLRMDGQTPVSKRKEIVRSFQSGDGPPFFFISLKTGGVGLNLTRANYVFHLDPWWNPAVENQASDRAHRIGQTQSVFVQRLIMQHSIEARMLELKARKAELFRQLVEEPGAQSAGAGLSRDDFDYLLNG